MKTSEIYINYNNTIYEKTELSKYKKVVYSQNGEDGIIEEIFNRVKPSEKFFVEFGGWDGINLSNTANLRINELWDGILFEGDNEKVKQNQDTIKIYNEYITSQNVNDLFEKYNVPQKFGVLSIDVDGDDAYIFESIDYDRFSPDLIIIEYNPGLPNHIPIRYKEQGINQTRENVEMGYYGANLNSMCDIAIKKGYKFVTTCDWNLFFIRKDLFNQLNIEDLDKNIIIKTQSNCEGSDSWRNVIMSHEMEWVIF
jgi:hypothetical protein